MIIRSAKYMDELIVKINKFYGTDTITVVDGKVYNSDGLIVSSEVVYNTKTMRYNFQRVKPITAEQYYTEQSVKNNYND